MKNALLPIALLSCISIMIFGFNQKKENELNTRTIDVGIFVSDLEKSLDFYTKIVGMKELNTWHLNAEQAKSAEFSNGQTMEIINLQLNDKPSTPIYKLVKIQGSKSKKLSHAQSLKAGQRYLTIHVDDYAPYLKRLKENNIQLWGGKPQDFPKAEKTVLIFQDPDGAMLEVIGPLKKAGK